MKDSFFLPKEYNFEQGINLWIPDLVEDFAFMDDCSKDISFKNCDSGFLQSLESQTSELITYLESHGFTESDTQWWFTGELMVEEI